MKGEAISGARDRLQIVSDARATIQNDARTAGTIRAAWWSFLMAFNGVFSKLQQGAKGDPASEAWFVIKARERKTDDLLVYLQHARNCEEHSVAASSATHGIRVIAGNQWTKVLNDGSDGQPVRIEVQSGKPLSGKVLTPGVHLLPVRDRGVVYPPPRVYRGKPLSSIEAALVAAEQYLSALIEEASQLPEH